MNKSKKKKTKQLFELNGQEQKKKKIKKNKRSQ